MFFYYNDILEARLFVKKIILNVQAYGSSLELTIARYSRCTAARVEETNRELDIQAH